MDIDTALEEQNTDYLYMDLSVNSLVEVTLGSGNSYGIIRWIGTLPDRQEIMAGLELVIFLLTCYCADESLIEMCNMYNYGNRAK